MKPEAKSALNSAINCTICILVVLMLGVALAFGVFAFYQNYEFEMETEDITYIELDLTSNSFRGEFRSELKSRMICGIDYEIEDGNLYITVLSTANIKNALPIDKDGYVKLEIKDIEKCDKVFYRGEKKDVELSV